jgi:uncharacterized protein
VANRFKEAEFAADLFAVDAGHAGEDYASPENFFRITFLTEGLKRILTGSLLRRNRAGDGQFRLLPRQRQFLHSQRLRHARAVFRVRPRAIIDMALLDVSSRITHRAGGVFK